MEQAMADDGAAMAGRCVSDITATSVAQHSTAQHSTAQHSTAQHSTAQHTTSQHFMTLLAPWLVLQTTSMPGTT
jgi:hypothetical protein